MSRIDQYLPYAFEAIKKVRITGHKQPVFSTDGITIPKVYKGYISSLGANIIQAGLKTAVYFYEAQESGSAGNKQLIGAAIYYILEKEAGNDSPATDGKLSNRLGNASEKMALRVMDAATALKLALRTYKMD